jgi:hypothetical protein
MVQYKVCNTQFSLYSERFLSLRSHQGPGCWITSCNLSATAYSGYSQPSSVSCFDVMPLLQIIEHVTPCIFYILNLFLQIYTIQY